MLTIKVLNLRNLSTKLVAVVRHRVGLPLTIVMSVLLGISTLYFANADTPGTPFAANSIWNAPLPATTPIDPVTPNFISWIKQDLTAYSGNGDINVDSYTPPIYTVTTVVNTVNFKFNDCQGKGYIPTNMLNQLANVPVPDYAKASAGTDQEMVVYQPSTDTVWEMWGAQKRVDGWYACWGGKIANVSSSTGMFPTNYGVTASGLSMLGGTIRANELQAGVINHAVGLSIIRTGYRNTSSASNDTSFTNSFVWPANRYDGWNNNASAPVEGTRLRLDPTINVDALGLTKTATAIAKAAQKYGLFIWDTSGAVGFRTENSVEFTSQGKANPYPAIFGSTPTYQQLAGFPWDKLQVLPAGYGKTGTSTELPPAPTTTTQPPDTSAPSISFSSPTNGATISGPVVIQASATDNVGVSKVEFYLNNTLKQTDTGAPYCYSGVNATPTCNSLDTTTLANGSYTLLAKAYDAAGNSSTTLPLSITISNPITTTPTDTPYTTAVSIPGRIEAENFDKGGEGVAYHDTETANLGGAYRTDGVDIRAAVEGGYQVGWTNSGEWLKYTVNATETGSYNLSIRLSSNAAGSVYHLESDGQNVTGSITVPNTGGYDTMTTITKTGVSLTAGLHVLRLVEDVNNASGNLGDLNWLELQKATTTSTFDTTPPSIPSTPNVRLVSGGHDAALSWSGSTDNVAVSGYYIYRNGVKIVGVSGTTYTDNAVDRGVTYTYHIAAYDAAYNTSAQSGSKSIVPTK